MDQGRPFELEGTAMATNEEEIAFQNGWINRNELAALGYRLRRNRYGEYLLRLAGDVDR